MAVLPLSVFARVIVVAAVVLVVTAAVLLVSAVVIVVAAVVLVVTAAVLVVTAAVLFNLVGFWVVRLGLFEVLVDGCGPTSKEDQLVSNIQR